MTTLTTNIQRMHLEVSSGLLFVKCNFNYNYTFTDITERVDQESYHSERVLKQVVSMLKLTHFHEANKGFGSYRSILYIDVRIKGP